jgi:hypothetical protein
MRRLRLLLVLILGLAVPVVLAPTASAAAPRDKSLEIVTIPPTPAARFLLDGQPVTTDARGVVRFLVPSSAAGHRIELANPTLAVGDTTSRFVRWHGLTEAEQGYNPVLDDVRVDHRMQIRVAFQETRTVRLSFVDQASKPVDPARIGTVTLHSDAGGTRTVAGAGPVDLVTSGPAGGDGPPVAKEPTYSVQSVTIDGANVVNVGEQRFRPGREEKVLEIVVLLRSAHFRVRDRLLGTPVPTSVEITYPDGRVEETSTDANGEVILPNLARGTYRVAALGQVYAVDQELTLSRSQFVDISVLTVLDAVIAGGIGVLVLALLLWIGRKRARVHRARLLEADRDRSEHETTEHEIAVRDGAQETGLEATTIGARTTGPPEPAQEGDSR